MPGAINLEPASCSTQCLLLTQALENAGKMYGMIKAVTVPPGVEQCQ